MLFHIGVRETYSNDQRSTSRVIRDRDYLLCTKICMHREQALHDSDQIEVRMVGDGQSMTISVQYGGSLKST